MAFANATLTEIRAAAHGLTVAIDCPPAMRPAPGQYLIANSPNPAETLPVVLFPASLPAEPLWAAGALPQDWTAGTPVKLNGPLGNGFHLPGEALRVALVDLDAFPETLLPLARRALAQGAAVAFYSERPPAALPAEIEVLPLALLAETLGWNDYLAAAFQVGSYAELRRLAGLHPHQSFHASAEGLVIAPMPCCGKAACGVCAIPTRRGWKHACEDGPVFNLNLLEES